MKTYQHNNLKFLKRDGLIALFLFAFTLLMIVRLVTSVQSSNSQANVYLGNVLIDTLDLTQNQIVTYEGRMGPVTVEVRDNKVAVIEETSPQNLCSLQGFVSSVLTPIICLPNEMIIQITGVEDKNGLDVLQ